MERRRIPPPPFISSRLSNLRVQRMRMLQNRLTRDDVVKPTAEPEPQPTAFFKPTQ